MASSKRKELTVWVGLLEGKIPWWPTLDGNGDCEKMDVYRKKKEAQLRYEEVRKMKLVEVD